MKQKEIFMMYLNNNRDRLEEDVRELRQRLRYRDCDAIDCVELMLAQERLLAFEEFAVNARAILKLSEACSVTSASDEDVNAYARYRINKERNKYK